MNWFALIATEAEKFPKTAPVATERANLKAPVAVAAEVGLWTMAIRVVRVAVHGTLAFPARPVAALVRSTFLARAVTVLGLSKKSEKRFPMTPYHPQN